MRPEDMSTDEWIDYSDQRYHEAKDRGELPARALPANGKTYRLVTDSNGTVEASSVHVSAADAVDMLAAEVLIHRLAGWRVSVSGEGLEVAINAERGDSRRVVTVEEV